MAFVYNNIPEMLKEFRMINHTANRSEGDS